MRDNESPTDQFFRAAGNAVGCAVIGSVIVVGLLLLVAFIATGSADFGWALVLFVVAVFVGYKVLSWLARL
ncbi:MAG: hypothetical protein OXH83_10220 [Bryobacterales bacterium]|nr:hypothetical protein [Bryobacterales bacterium]